MGRLYTSVFEGVTVSAAQNLFALLASSTVPLLIHTFEIGQSSDFGDAQDENLRIRVRRGMTSNGSGGTTPAMNPVDPRELTSATATCRANDTTAASGGTIVTMWASTFSVRAGYVWLPTPAIQLICGVSTRIAVDLPDAPADALTMSGTIVWEEAF